ncbi:uncharacterized protein LOC134533326 [Bacillus rossius redtenbacheri]|uniref:uncharacterized protein LOC134533326 n=1 Tax=Bacillus rossius redtenbacheri TaxID=93214 RepID=UPI002FDE92CB
MPQGTETDAVDICPTPLLNSVSEDKQNNEWLAASWSDHLPDVLQRDHLSSILGNEDQPSAVEMILPVSELQRHTIDFSTEILPEIPDVPIVLYQEPISICETPCNNDSFDYSVLANTSDRPNISEIEYDKASYIGNRENTNSNLSLECPDDPDWPIVHEETVDNELTNQNNTDVIDGDTDGNVSQKKRSGRKRKNENQTKKIAKQKRNSNEDFYNYKGQLVQRKLFRDFECKCIRKCHSLVSTATRNEEFNKFWKLGDYNSQNMYIGACVKEVGKKRQYTSSTSKRNFSRVYTIRTIPVCRETFTETFQISSKRVNTALCKLRSDDLLDKRGKKQGGLNKVSDKKMEEVMAQINKIPRYKSHYRRANTDAEFLPPEMTLQKMYDLYLQEKTEQWVNEGGDEEKVIEWNEANEYKKKEIIKEIDAVSFSTYRRIFLTKFDLKFKSLKKDTCKTCDAFAARSSTVTGKEKKEIQDAHNNHKDIWMNAHLQLRKDTEEAQQDISSECLTFDLEKTLPLPRIPANNIFYKRQLWVYNAGVHSCKTGTGYCYVWVENQAGRGAQEIGSCLIKHIQNHVGNNIKHLVLWNDSAGGQNRNIKIVLMLKACLEDHPSLQSVTLKFLLSGHSFLPNDADFSDIECALKHVQRLYLPAEYIEVKMQSRDFFGTEKLETMVVNRKVTQEKEKINWLNIREIKIMKEEPLKIFTRTDFQSSYSVVDLEKKPTKGRQVQQFSYRSCLVPMWVGGKDIAAPKLKDLKSIMSLIPNDAKEFYRSLTGSRSVEDDIDGFCAPLDFETE